MEEEMISVSELIQRLAMTDAVFYSDGGTKPCAACALFTAGSMKNGRPPVPRRLSNGHLLWVADLADAGKIDTEMMPEAEEGAELLLFFRKRPRQKIAFEALFPGAGITVLAADIPFEVLFSQIQQLTVCEMRGITYKAALAESLFEKKSLKEIVDQAADMLKSPVILTTSAYRVLAMNDAGLAFQDPVWDAAYETGYCDAASIQHFESENITTQVQKTSSAFVLDTGLAREIPRILQKIEAFGRISAYIGVFQISHAFNESDLQTVDLICMALSVLMEKTPAELDNTSEICQSILSDLLSGSIKSATLLGDRIRSAFWKPLPFFRCAALIPVDETKGIVNADYLIRYLTRQIPYSRTILAGNGLMVLLNFQESGKKEPFEKELAAVAQEYRLRIGISNEFRDLIRLRGYYRTSCMASSVIRKLPAADPVIYFSDVVFYTLADRIPEEDKAAYVQTAYTRLEEYDSKNHTEFCRTLAVYIESGCSSALSSSRLFIHRNTMTHRLEKIESVCGIDIRNGKELLYFYYSLKAAEWNVTE